MTLTSGVISLEHELHIFQAQKIFSLSYLYRTYKKRGSAAEEIPKSAFIGWGQMVKL